MKTLPSTILLLAVLASGCALFDKPEALYQDVPQPTEASVSLPQQAMEEPSVPTPAPAAAAPTPAKSSEPVPPAAHATAPAPAKPAVAPPPAAVVMTPALEELAASAKPMVTADLSMRGKVVAYNAVGKFVVLSFQVGRMPTIGQQLSIFRGNLKVGEVRITGPQKEENTIADLVAGDASSGDEARLR